MDIKLIQLQKHGDERGQLVALEESKNIPFPIKRVYYMFETSENVRRGFHAHHKLQQLAIPVRGSCRILLDDGIEKIEVYLDNPAQGLAIDPMIWHEMYDFSSDCVLMVLADDFYNESDYIRNYEEFQKVMAKNE
ncbi:sugar 3,4-ketoisomerase [Hafnia alvei]|uniref:sugar 3,4-ketoisomerase n=1 Tax=Hafnia alvei TaxID=569 RepID=UPI0040445D31